MPCDSMAGPGRTQVTAGRASLPRMWRAVQHLPLMDNGSSTPGPTELGCTVSKGRAVLDGTSTSNRIAFARVTREYHKKIRIEIESTGDRPQD
ncbi:unnamed protein product [Arctogadus glacialis]